MPRARAQTSALAPRAPTAALLQQAVVGPPLSGTSRHARSSSFASARSLPVATLGRTEKQQSATGCCRVRRWLRLLQAGARRATGSLMGVPPPIRASANRDLGVERSLAPAEARV